VRGEAEPGADDAAVGDDHRLGRAEVAAEGIDPGREGAEGFPAGRGEVDVIGGPGVDLGAREVGPEPVFPGAEIEFLQARIDANLNRTERIRELATALGRARADEPEARRKLAADCRRLVGKGGGERHVGAPVAKPGSGGDAGVAHKDHGRASATTVR